MDQQRSHSTPNTNNGGQPTQNRRRRPSQPRREDAARTSSQPAQGQRRRRPEGEAGTQRRRQRSADAEQPRRRSGQRPAETGSQQHRRRNAQRPAGSGSSARRPQGSRNGARPRNADGRTHAPAQRRGPQGSPMRRTVLPIVIIACIVLFVVGLVVFGVTRCTSKGGQTSQQQQQTSQATSTASSASSSSKDEKSSSESSSSASSSSASSASGVKVPDDAWKKAAGVNDLTSDGTDPTKIAAEMEAERVAANKKDGYEGVEDPWLKSGKFTTGDQELDEMVKEFCDGHSTDGSSATDNAYNTFCNITWSDYNEWEGNQHPHTYDWTVQYAKDFFTKGGNCFSMAAAIQWCLRYYGYSDAHAELTYQLRQSGGSLDHGLTWVTDLESNEIRLVDSEMAAKGWMMSPGAYTVEILDPTGDWEPRSSAFARSEMT